MSETGKPGDPWAKIEKHELTPLGDLFRAEPDRLSKLSIDVAGIHFE